MSSSVRLINHASVKITVDDTSILSDPWYEGSVFHKGWKLIHEVPQNEYLKYLEKTDYIYVSHEHPDHFSPAFFLDKNIKSLIVKNNTKILFQETKDRRVVNFLKKNGYEVIEVLNNSYVFLKNNIKIKIIKFGYVDSALIVEGSKHKILNLNDCPLNEVEDIKKFKNKHGNFDLLLTQFSYAAWKGNKENKNFRKSAAEEKLKTLINQYKILDCKKVIPFASFIYFSNELNKFMNDEINKPHIMQNYLMKEIDSIILAPGEEQSIDNLEQNDSSINFWKSEYNKLNTLPIEKFNNSISFKDLH